jgi:hypothetical protein
MRDATGQRLENKFIAGIGTTGPRGLGADAFAVALRRLPFRGVTDVTMPVPKMAFTQDRWNAPREPW